MPRNLLLLQLCMSPHGCEEEEEEEEDQSHPMIPHWDMMFSCELEHVCKRETVVCECL